VNTLRTGDFFVAKAPWRRGNAFWHCLNFYSGITTASGCIFHALSTSAGHLTSSDPRVHFGFGTESEVASIEARCRNGIVQTLMDMAADLVLKIGGPRK
jgi:hypothetical protein